MGTTDFNVEFDLLYNNALGTSAPSVNTYEKSLFLTQAQENIIRSLYENKVKGLSFEQSERSRRRLEPLTITSKVTFNSPFDTNLNDLKISPDSKFFQISDTYWYIVFEQVTTSTGKRIKVIPTSLDQYSVLSENPFKKPNARKAWRLTTNDTVSNETVVEILSTQTLTTYTYKYLDQPSPIILVDLSTDPEFSGLGLEINGISAETNCILPAEIHRVVLTEAVALATLAYKENTLSNNVQLNQNNSY